MAPAERVAMCFTEDQLQPLRIPPAVLAAPCTSILEVHSGCCSSLTGGRPCSTACLGFTLLFVQIPQPLRSALQYHLTHVHQGKQAE